MNILKERIKLSIANPNWHRILNLMSNSRNKKAILFGTPMHGNLGDHAIAIQEKYFLEDFFSDYEFFEILMPMFHTQKNIIKKNVKPDDLIFISGGGWMGNLWLHNENVIREIVKMYPNNKIIIFPQTIYYTSDSKGNNEYRITNEIFGNHNNLHIFVREKKSYDFIKQRFELNGKSNVYLFPDMALYGKNMLANHNKIENNHTINICIRNDCESIQNDIDKFLKSLKKNYNIVKVSTVVKSPIVLNKRTDELKKSWEIFSNAEITITDRLHAMLFSVLNGTPCIVLDNKTGKVFGVAEWLKETKMIIKANSLNDVLDILEKGKKWNHNKFDINFLLPYFDEMATIIRKD